MPQQTCQNNFESVVGWFISINVDICFAVLEDNGASRLAREVLF